LILAPLIGGLGYATTSGHENNVAMRWALTSNDYENSGSNQTCRLASRADIAVREACGAGHDRVDGILRSYGGPSGCSGMRGLGPLLARIYDGERAPNGRQQPGQHDPQEQRDGGSRPV
jgi:hypothetical protein